MADPIKMYDLAPSPNSMKVRIALRFKELPFEKVAVDPMDRTAIVKLSGQPLTPVLQHGDRVVFDSGAILRYLEANFRSSRPLFSTDYDTMHEIEDWEAFGRGELVAPVGMVFGQAFAEKKDPSVCEAASKMLNDGTARIEERLSKGDWLVGDQMTAADVTCAPVVFYGMLPEPVAQSSDIARFFAASLKLGAGRERTRAWCLRVMAYDK